MSFPRLDKVRADLKEARDTVRKAFDDMGPEYNISAVTVLDGDDDETKFKSLEVLNDKITKLTAEETHLVSIQRAGERQKADSDNSETPEVTVKSGNAKMSLGSAFVKSLSYKTRRSGSDSAADMLNINTKTLMDRANGWEPTAEDNGRIQPKIFSNLSILDVVPQTSTTSSSVTYWEETTSSDDAAATAEGGPYAEATIELTQRSVIVEKITSWLPITDEQLADENRTAALVDNRLRLFLQRAAAREVAAGNGTSPHISGFLDHAIQELEYEDGDSLSDKISLGAAMVATNGAATPTAILIHPLDYHTLRTSRNDLGTYELGTPLESVNVSPWGIPVVQTEVIPQGTVLMGDFAAHSELVMRKGVDVQVSNSHSDFFVKGKQAIRADMRAALIVYRDEAFLKITGLPDPTEES